MIYYITKFTERSANSYLDLTDYSAVQTLTDERGVPTPPYPDDLGVFKTEPVLYIGTKPPSMNWIFCCSILVCVLESYCSDGPPGWLL
jgi:hypothetical protein